MFRRAIFFLIFMETLSRGWLEKKHSRMAPGNQVRQNLTVLLAPELQVLDNVTKKAA